MELIDICGIVMALCLFVPDFYGAPRHLVKGGLSTACAFFRFVCLFLLCFNIGILQFADDDLNAQLFWIWLPIGLALCIGYLVCFFFYRKSKRPALAGGMTVLACAVYLLAALPLVDVLSLLLAATYSILRMVLALKHMNENRSDSDQN